MQATDVPEFESEYDFYLYLWYTYRVCEAQLMKAVKLGGITREEAERIIASPRKW